MKTRTTMLTALVITSLTSGVVMAAPDVAIGTGNGVNYGTNSYAPEATNVAVGNSAKIDYANGVANRAGGDIAIGYKARTGNYVNQGGGIAIGQNAFSENMAGNQEMQFNFNQTTFQGTGFMGLRSPFTPADPSKVSTGIAIGQNAYARSGSIMIGTHNYKGTMGDNADLDTTETAMRNANVNVNATTIGNNSHTNAAFGTNLGAYNIITGSYTGGNTLTNTDAAKNFGSTIVGTLNTIESKSAVLDHAGIANTITGIANKTANTNGTIIMGAGNEVTNSATYLTGAPTSGASTPNKLAEKLRTVIQRNHSGGSTAVIGGGNKADYTQATSIIGIDNVVTGTNANKASNNFIVGNNHTVTNASDVIAIGSTSSGVTTTASNSVSIGKDANVLVDGGVALGGQSVANTAAGITGYDVSTNTTSTETNSTWRSTASAVSVGNADDNITRQITGVSAGSNDTDAVNVAQLKKVASVAGKETTIVTGTNVNTTTATNASGGTEYTIDINRDLINMGTIETKDGANHTYTKGDGVQVTDESGNESNLTKEGLTATDGTNTVTFTTTKVDVANNRIQNVADAVDNGDAVNFKQLKQYATNAASSAASTVSGTGAVEVTTSTNTNGSTNYNVSLNTDRVRDIAKTSNRYAGDDVIKVERWSNPTGSADLTTFKFNADKAAEKMNIGYTANGGTVLTTTVAKGFNFVDGDHINASVAADGKVKFDLDRALTDQIDNNTTKINNLENAIHNANSNFTDLIQANQKEARRGIASASALAALHPLDFDPDHKLDIMAGVGHFKGQTATALGAAYRPSENIMFTVGTSINGKDTAINAGVSYKVGTKVNGESRYSKVAMQHRIDELNNTVAEQNQKIDQLNALVEKLLNEVYSK